MTRVVAAVTAHTPTATADFRFIHVINFNAPIVKVEPAAAPDTITAAVTEAAKPVGTACTAEVVNAPARTEAEITLPRRAKKLRSFSSALVIRFWAASRQPSRACISFMAAVSP